MLVSIFNNIIIFLGYGDYMGYGDYNCQLSLGYHEDKYIIWKQNAYICGYVSVIHAQE